MSNVLEFSTKIKKLPVKIDGKQYTIQELNGEERDLYMDMGLPRLGEDKKLKTVKGMQADLLSICLRDSNGELVSKKTILAWPGAVQGGLFEAARDLSGLDEASEEEAKND